MTPKLRIAKLLSSGMPPTTVASVTGVSTSYLSQLAHDEEFKALLTDVQGQQAPEGEESDSSQELFTNADILERYKVAEVGILRSVQTALASTTELSDLVKALKVLGDLSVAREKIASPVPVAPAGTVGNLTVVNLTMPTAFSNHEPKIVTSPTNEILSVDDLNLLPASGAEVKDMMHALRHGIDAKYQEAKNAALNPTAGKAGPDSKGSPDLAEALQNSEA